MLEGVGVILDKVGKDTCPICEKAPHPARTTSDKKAGNGCLDSIPANLGCEVLPQVPDIPNYATAAHHIIPANQCLKQFKRLSQMCKTVGYNVNNSANGMPLPTCGQQLLNRYENSEGKKVKYRKLSDADKENVAFQIMLVLDMQWHVGHHNWSLDLTTDRIKHPVNYDKLVKLKLRDLEKDLAKRGKKICDPDDGSESGSAVISELNSLSAEIKTKVKNWSKYFVSAMSYRFAADYH